MDRPNVLLVMTDQQRGDCLGADPHVPTDSHGDPLVFTPNLDALAEAGVLFARNYAPTPSSIPARRCLRTGQTPSTNGCPNWTTEPWDFEHTISGELGNAGYQTGIVGKLHSQPTRNALGFDHLELQPGAEYDSWLAERLPEGMDEYDHGLGPNDWDARPWPYEEHLHPTVWTTNRAIDFLENRDPQRPFFLNLSYLKPHTPLDPPQPYWDQYDNAEIPEPYIGDWVDETHGEGLPDHPTTDAWRADLPTRAIRRARVGYYGLITHIDHQVWRVFDLLRSQGEWENTLVIFTSDHGEMLGDHHLWRKVFAYEGSARVPLIVKPPKGISVNRGRTVQQPVGLEDLMPTILETVDVAIPDTVEGRSLLPFVAGENPDWRDTYHGEHGPIYEPQNAMQFVVDERWKFVWNPVTDDCLLFDLQSDPGETVDRSDDPDCRAEYDRLRSQLVDRLRSREEGFVEGGELVPTELEFSAGHYDGYYK